MKRRILELLLLCSLALFSGVSIRDTVAQGKPSGFDAAVEAYESGEYEQTISLLAAYEKSKGTSPRLESLRALAYRDLEKPKEAHQAILVYLRLTANRNMGSSEAHQDMLKLRDEMLEAIEKKYEEDKEKLDKERDETAASVVEELESFYSSPQIKRSYSSALPASLKTEADDANGEYIGPPPTESKTAPGMNSLAELEMWRKINQSTVAMDYFLFIESFPNGQFTQIARKKMMDIGDPAWNAIKDSFDPFVYREFIKNNPDSPFLRVAKTTMDALAQLALKWEQVKDSNNEEELRNIESWFPKSPYAAEARKIRAQLAWAKIKGSADPKAFDRFVLDFPDSPFSTDARNSADRLRTAARQSPLRGVFRHEHDYDYAAIEVSFDGERLRGREIKTDWAKKDPDPRHNFDYGCSDLFRVESHGAAFIFVYLIDKSTGTPKSSITLHTVLRDITLENAAKNSRVFATSVNSTCSLSAK